MRTDFLDYFPDSFPCPVDIFQIPRTCRTYAHVVLVLVLCKSIEPKRLKLKSHDKNREVEDSTFYLLHNHKYHGLLLV